MNILSVGFDKTPLLSHIPRRCLIIDDGPFIDHAELPRAKIFDPHIHSFNVLRQKDHRTVRMLSDIFYAADPGGDATLTVRNGKRALARLLMSHSRLDEVTGNLKDPAEAEALGVLDNVLFSPVVRRILTGPTNFHFTQKRKGDYLPAPIVARLNRAELGDFDAFLIGNLLIAQYPGTVVVPDFGFYGHKGHMALIRQNRLIAGINFFDEVPALRNHLLTIPTKIGSHCVPEDAEVLARYAGHSPTSRGFRMEVERLIKPTVPESET